jgi:3-methylcrotonyl-CoA carboxylase alpha subunit
VERGVSFSKLLVANRGEVAVRVIRACRELGVSSVAVYSEADEGAMHRRLADEACPVGPGPAAQSYLNIARLVEVIGATGVEAVHPGYGFLSESAAFARAVRASGAAWVGPPPEAMDLVGSKVRAKKLAESAGVPVVPGYDGEDDSEDSLVEEAQRIGYPVLVKASSGGGGRGMRPVANPRDLREAVRGAKREAEAAFGDDSVFLEKLMQAPRHVEVQIIADHHGNVIHLFERECSIQRRNQKVVEEAPSPALSPELRESMCAAAVRLAREAGYRNAGTVEFLLDGTDFYFLEMNARLQVEHPVTELITGLDLVHLQLAVASGEPLPVSQEEVSARGSAIEVRLYAEERGLPAGGRLLSFVLPEGSGVRNDAGVESGDQISLFYDSMLAKTIVCAPDRERAVSRLRRALRDYRVLGVPTNLPLLRRVAAHPAFAAGDTRVDFLQRHRLTVPPTEPRVPREAVLLAAAGELSRDAQSAPADPFLTGPWRHLGAVQLLYRAGGAEHEVGAERLGSGSFVLRSEGRESAVEVLFLGAGELRATIDGRTVGAGYALDGADVLVSLEGTSYRLARRRPPDVDGAGPGEADASGSGLTAPMPGTVVKVLVREGDEVEEGQLLLVLEAMKMEQPVTAPYAGRVRSLPLTEGALVSGGAVLAEIERI